MIPFSNLELAQTRKIPFSRFTMGEESMSLVIEAIILL